MRPHDDLQLAPGVSRPLALSRRAAIRTLRYDLTFDIPADVSAPIVGRVAVHITWTSPGARWSSTGARPIVLDFAGAIGDVLGLRVGGEACHWGLEADHLVITPSGLGSEPDGTASSTRVDVAFRVPTGAVHRRDDLVYSLFVPARAHRAFPCIDQPDIKAPFVLTLVVPAHWTAVSNAAAVATEFDGEGPVTERRARVRFAETAPLPTYLVTFAAGLFSVEADEDAEVPFRLLHQDPDTARVRAQFPEIARQHAAALRWLATYTSRPYAFGKLDIVLIPGFQFGGMEHPGAIFYAMNLLLLDGSASEDQRLGRAGLIAHETAHMWFGNLVTIRWFDDVWLKEVFATFFSGRIVAEWFPALDHDVRFLLCNYPAAYDVDRTAGTHPVRQPLENLEDAGSLYGAIIYRKAPIVMRQLEWSLGAERFREAVRAYIARFAHGVADWPDLLDVFASIGFDATAWSRGWIESAGRPSVRLPPRGAGTVSESGVDGTPPQSFETVPLHLDGEREPAGVLPSPRRPPYGVCLLDDSSQSALAGGIERVGDPAVRAMAWVLLWDDVLDGRLDVDAFLSALERAVPREPVEQILQFLSAQGARVCWRFVHESRQREWLRRLEGAWFDALSSAQEPTRVATCFWGYQRVAVSDEGCRTLRTLLTGDAAIAGLVLSERDCVTVALWLAVVTNTPAHVEAQLSRLVSADERARAQYLRRAISSLRHERDAMFDDLRRAEHRVREPWAIEAVGLLNHPLRAAGAAHYLRPGLELLPEIQRTGDIFLPQRWCDALLHGHAGTDADQVVRRFLEEQAALPDRLRRTVLQSADDLFRARRPSRTS